MMPAVWLTLYTLRIKVNHLTDDPYAYSGLSSRNKFLSGVQLDAKYIWIIFLKTVILLHRCKWSMHYS